MNENPRFDAIFSLFFISSYLICDILLPIYNKLLYAGFGKVKGFHFPVTTTFFQILSTTICLGIVVLGLRLFMIWRERNQPVQGSEDALDPEEPKKKTLFSVKHVLLKGLIILPVGFFFAGVITLSNLGLDKVNFNVHVLLRTTTVGWIVLFSYCMGETPTKFQLLFTFCILLGTVLLGLDVALGWSDEHSGNVIGVAVNLASSFCSGAMVSILRIIIRLTKNTPLEMGVVELTMYKMGIASVFISIPALCLDVLWSKSPNFFQAIKASPYMIGVIILGILITMTYQSSVVAVTTKTRAISVGVLHQFMIIPQMIVFTIIQSILPSNWNLTKFTWTRLHVLGALIIIFGMIGYTSIRLLRDFKPKKQPMTQSKVIN